MRHTAFEMANADRHYAPAAGPGDPPRIDPKWVGADTADLGKLMRKSPNFASLGAIGPDLFFFLPDFRDLGDLKTASVLVAVLDFLQSLYNAVDPYVTLYEKYLGPISEDQAEEASRLSGGLSESFGNIVGDLSSILITFLEKFVTEQGDVFKFFSLGLDRGYDEQAFLWSDMLHYRDTGQFARALWRRADGVEGDDQLRAYALGYQTHVATDVTGHAFVNAIAGGPYRTHWQRHHLVENHMDAFWYGRDTTGPANGDQYPQLTESALYYDVAFADGGDGPVARPAYPTGGTMRDNWTRSRLLDLDSDMPPRLSQMLLDAMTDVWYQTPDTSGGGHPAIFRTDQGRPNVDTIAEAYGLFFRYLKLVTVDGFAHEPPAIPDVFPNLSFPTISDPGDDGSGASAPGDDSDDGSFWDDLLAFFLSLIRVLAYIVEVAEYLLTLPWAVLADLVTYPLRLGLYYAFEKPLADLLKTFRMGLVMTGYMLPMSDEVATFLTHVGGNTARGFNDLLSDVNDVFGGLLPVEAPSPPTYRDPDFPHSIVFDKEGNTTEYRAPWNYPESPVEQHLTPLGNEGPPATPLLNPATGGYQTTAGPYAMLSSPLVLFTGVHQDPTLRDRFELARTPGDADVVGMSVTPTAHLGGCVEFSQYLLWLESRDPIQAGAITVPVVEWNMDADMGYGYHCWDWDRDGTKKASDPEGNPVFAPCTDTEQLDTDVFGKRAWSVWPASTRLSVHWVGPGIDAPTDCSAADPPPPPPPAPPIR